MRVIMNAVNIFDVETGTTNKPVLTMLSNETEEEARIFRYGKELTIKLKI